MASGSGAIISEDGYIVTNNHVIDGADDINVTLSNQKSFKAKLVATDPSSDLAIIKIEAKGLPFLLYGNSDEAQVGQWVLAVGYPLNIGSNCYCWYYQCKRKNAWISIVARARARLNHLFKQMQR